MQATLRIPTRAFRDTLQRYAAATKKDLREIVNQRALNVAGHALVMLPPADVRATRTKVAQYLRQPVATKIKLARSGARKGHFVRRGSKASQLNLAILIVQARRKKEGGKGLYGQEMRAALRKFKGRSIGGVGFLKSVLLPIITTLNPLVKYKVPFTATRDISRWPHSAGSGRVTPAFDSMRPLAIIHLHFDLRQSGQDAKVQAIVGDALAAAIESERREMAAQIQSKLLATAQRFQREK